MENQQVAIITGGSSGIGLDAAKKLVSQGIYCIIASRNIENVNAAVQGIKTETGRDNVEGMRIDLADLESVRSFVSDFNDKNLPLHILVNNAGIQNRTKVVTKDGIEATFASNHIGHFLLTHLLLDKLKQNAPSRIVVVASTMHDYTKGKGGKEIKLEEYNFDTAPYDGVSAYRFSKLANIEFTYALSRRLEGTGVVVNCMCPGFIPATSLSRSYPYFLQWLLRNVIPLFIRSVIRTIDHGGNCIVDLATKKDETIEHGGQFFFDRTPTPTTARSHDEEEQEKLWKLSEKLVGI